MKTSGGEKPGPEEHPGDIVSGTLGKLGTEIDDGVSV